MNYLFARCILLLALLHGAVICLAQAKLSGTITGTQGIVMPGVRVALSGLNLSVMSDHAGKYLFNNVKNGHYLLLVGAEGYAMWQDTVLISGTSVKMNIRLEATINELAEVFVKAKTNAVLAREQPQNLTVIDVKPYYNRPEGTLALINQAAGVKVRQSGGLGSNADFYLNGLSGKQLRFFVDDIPLNYLGPGLNLNILPVNSIERVDIYKGVVPVNLGADVLGGAINVVTRQTTADYIDASYALSSFNTHRATLNLRKNLGQHLYTDVNAFYNTTANNYKVDVTIPNALGNPEPFTVTRFHDHFHNLYANARIGLRKLKWADDISYLSSYSKSFQQIQNNLVMTQPYGRVTYTDNSWNNGLAYRKTWDKISLKVFAGINQLNGHFVDTSLNTYNWLGQVVARRSSGGESFGPLLNLRLKQLNKLVRINTNYKVDQVTNLELAITGTNFTQNENNPATAAFPVGLKQLIAGLALNRLFFSERLLSTTSVKYFGYSNRGYQIGSGGDYQAASATKKQFGWNEALRYVFNGQLSAKASYEYAARLPDQSELFGTYTQRTRPNPSLVPETSHNINLGIDYQTGNSHVAANGFYRLANNLIYAPPSPYFLLYQNLLKAQFTGVEAEYMIRPVQNIRFSINATYQNIINRSPQGSAGDTDNRHYGLRLPNIPFLFGNSELQWNHDGFRKTDKISAWYNLSYVHWYYLYWANDGDATTKAIIPTQIIQNTGVSYAFDKNAYALSMEVQNLAASKVYDNYNVQLPGRSVHLKIRYFLQ